MTRNINYNSLVWSLSLVYVCKHIVILMVSGNEAGFTGNDSISNLAGLDSSVNLSENMLSHNNSKWQQPAFRNALQDPYFCGQIVGGHYMFGSASSYCGGYTVRDCSALCFYRNFTFFQCEGFVCHCFTS